MWSRSLGAGGLYVIVAVLGCSSGTSSTGGDGGGETTPVSTCAAKTASLKGSVDGTNIDQSYTGRGYALVVKNFSGYIGASGRIEVVLVGAGVSSEGSAIASAKLTMPAEGPLGGKVFCATGGQLTSGTSYTFTLTGLQASDGTGDGGTCSGTPVSGTLSGCIGGGR